MKILYITTLGVAMSHYMSLIEELIAEGNVVDIATNESTSPVPDFYKKLSCNIYHIDTSRSPISLGNLRAVKQIRKIVQNNGYDIVHCHTPLAAAATRLACKKLRKQGKVKVIYTAHGFHFYKGAPLKNWLFFYPVEKLCSRYTDLLITINKEDYELAKKKMKAKKVMYVPGVGVEVSKFAAIFVDKKQKRAEIGVPEDAFMLLSVGELNKNKNHKVVIKAISQLKDSNIHYVIAGIGKRRDNLQSLASKLGVNLHLLGFRNDIPYLDKIADCYVLPSIREGLNVSVMEAMASGLVCIVSNARGNSELIDKKGGFLCKSSSANEFAEAIKKVKASNLEEYSSYNLKKIIAFDKALINAQMRRIYDQVLSSCGQVQ